MKKRLLITSALMTAVLGASLATGTYAWYSVGKGSMKKVADEATIQTQSSGVQIKDLLLTIDITLTAETLDLTDTSGKSYVVTYENASGDDTLKEVTPKNASGEATITVTPTIDGKTPETLELAAYAGTYTLTVNASTYVRLTKTADDKFKDENKNAEITLSYVIGTDGTAKLDNGESVVLYYSVMPSSYKEKEEMTVHANDKITADFKEIAAKETTPAA